MNDRWYYEQHGTPHGPLDREQLEQLVARGAIGSACLVWQEGMAAWTTAAAAGLGGGVSPPLPPPLPMTAAMPPTAPPQVVGPPRALRRPPPASLNWPIVAAGGGLALILAVVLGWIAHSLTTGDAESPRNVAAAPAPTVRSPQQQQNRPHEPPPSQPLAQPLPATMPPVLPAAAEPPPAAEPTTREPIAAADAAGATVGAGPAANADPPASKPATNTAPPTQPTPAPAKPQTLYQELDIRRAPKFSILGAITAQDLHYQILSALRVGMPSDDGSRKIEQYVHDTRLLKADDLSRSMFEQSLRDLSGWQFTYQISRRGLIIDWRSGPPDGRKAARVETKGAEGFMVTSVMDEDGWKEMAQLSFFVPEEQTSGSQSWTRQMTHDFGPLGSWYGETRFTPKATRKGLLQVDYTHDMTYAPPGKGKGDLPFTIVDASFKPEVASGTFQYDTQAGRVQSVQERFFVRGAVSAEILGQALPVEVEEDQMITVRILDLNPWEE